MRIEPLEDRLLMAAGVTTALSGGVLRIDASAKTPWIDVRQSGGRLLVVAEVETVVTGPTQVSHGLETQSSTLKAAFETVGNFAANAVKEIDLYGHAGNKTIDIEPSVQVPRVQIDAGSGNDALYLIAGRDKLVAGTGADRVTAIIDPRRYLNAGAPYALVGAGVQYGGGLARDTFDVYLDLSSFGSAIVGPALQEAQAALRFFQPLVTTLNSQVPLVSDLSEAAGGPAYTYLDAFNTFADTGTRQDLANFLGVYNAVENFPLGAFTGYVHVGTFSAPNPQTIRTVQGLSPLSQLKPGNAIVQLQQLGIHFPLLEQPVQDMRLLFGQTVPLVTYDGLQVSAQANVSTEYDIQTPVPGVYAEVGLGGQPGGAGRPGLRLGLDRPVLARLLDGFSIQNAYAQLSPSLSINGGVAVGVPDSGFAIAKIYAQATLSGQLQASLPGNYNPATYPGSLAGAISYSGDLSVSGGGYLQYSQLINDITTGNIGGFLGGLFQGLTGHWQNHTATLFTVPTVNLYQFG